MRFFGHNLKTLLLDFDEIWPKVAEYGLSSFEANPYVRKNPDLKIIHLMGDRFISWSYELDLWVV